MAVIPQNWWKNKSSASRRKTRGAGRIKIISPREGKLHEQQKQTNKNLQVPGEKRTSDCCLNRSPVRRIQINTEEARRKQNNPIKILNGKSLPTEKPRSIWIHYWKWNKDTFIETKSWESLLLTDSCCKKQRKMYAERRHQVQEAKVVNGY